MTLHVSLVGAGSFAKMHLEAYSRNPKVKVRWLCDPNLDNANKYATQFDVPKVTADFRDSLNDPEVDIVDIMAPNYLHKPIAIAAMEAGKSVICEKPMALNAAESEEMAEASRRTGMKLFVKYHQRFDPVHQKVREMVASGEFDRPVMALVTLFGNHLPSMTSRGHWRGNPALCGGGCLFSSGSHVLDLIHFFFGDLKAVTATTRQLVANNPDKGDDNATVIMEFQSGVVANFVGCWTTDRWTWAKEIHGVGGSLAVIQDERKANVLQWTRGGTSETVLVQPDWFDASNFASINHFVDYVLDLTEPLYTLDDCIRSMRTLELAYRSSEEGRRIAVEG